MIYFSIHISFHFKIVKLFKINSLFIGQVMVKYFEIMLYKMLIQFFSQFCRCFLVFFLRKAEILQRRRISHNNTAESHFHYALYVFLLYATDQLWLYALEILMK